MSVKNDKIAFVFTGQGSQYEGMGKDLYETSDIARKVFETATEVTGIDVANLCFNTEIQELTKTENAQLAIFVYSYAMYMDFVEKNNIRADYLAGHSLGEITALTCAGVFKFEDACRIVKKRGQLMGEISRNVAGSMIAVMGQNYDKVEAICSKIREDNEVLSIANYNSDSQIVVSGCNSAIEKLLKYGEDNGIKCVKVKVSAPFHSSLISPIVESFSEELEKYTYYSMETPVLSNVLGDFYETDMDISKALCEHIVNPVLWKNEVTTLIENGVGTIIEIGPGKVLKKISFNCINEYNSEGQSYEVNALSLEKDTEEVARFVKNYKSRPTLISLCIRISVCTENKNADSSEYENEVICNYKKLTEIQTRIDKNGCEPSEEDMRSALDLLDKILKAKKISDSEKAIRMNQLKDFVEDNKAILELINKIGEGE